MDDPLFNLISRHFVALGCDYQSFNEDGSLLAEGLVLYSGFVMEINKQGFWVTAGHCLKDMDRLVDKGLLRIVGGGFMDYFSENAVHRFSYPYTYDRRDSISLYLPAYGIDFGVVNLDSLMCQAFFRNGVVPIFEEDWRGTENIEFDAYKMLGVPAETIYPRPNEVEIGLTRAGIRIHPLSADHPARTSRHPDWFVGELDQACPLKSIEGMSGGPIYGMSIRDEIFSYRPVAIQSQWNEDTRIIYGCPLEYVASELQDFLSTYHKKTLSKPTRH